MPRNRKNGPTSPASQQTTENPPNGLQEPEGAVLEPQTAFPELPAGSVAVLEVPYIAEGLRPLAVPIAGLIADPLNARFHPQENIDAIKASLRQFGQDQPLVVHRGTNIVRKGNGRLQAARELGWPYLAVVYIDEDDVDAAARAIADNRTAELAKWDQRVLAAVMVKIQEARPSFQPQSLGFTTDQMERLHAKYTATAAVQPPVTSAAPVSGGLDAVGATPAEAAPGGTISHVRMVQLFLNTTTQPVFQEMVLKLADAYQTGNHTDTVMEALKRECQRIAQEVPEDEHDEAGFPPDTGESE